MKTCLKEVFYAVAAVYACRLLDVVLLMILLNEQAPALPQLMLV